MQMASLKTMVALCHQFVGELNSSFTIYTVVNNHQLNFKFAIQSYNDGQVWLGQVGAIMDSHSGRSLQLSVVEAWE